MSFLDISFDDATVTYTLIGFGDETAALVADPKSATNMVAKLDKPASSPLWAGTTISTQAAPPNSIPTLPITATRTKMSVRVYLPDANVPVRLKVEDANDPTHSVESEVNSGAANTWQTLTYDFTMQAAGTAALNPAYTFNKASIFVNFGTDGATAGAKSYYIDDLIFY
jgi:hypothetical protein